MGLVAAVMGFRFRGGVRDKPDGRKKEVAFMPVVFADEVR
jgi:hypothetical protein